MDKKKIIDPASAELRLGDPKNCQGNGQDPEFECYCDECDHYLACYSENSKIEYMMMD